MSECTHSRGVLVTKFGRLGCSMFDQAYMTLELMEEGALVEAG
jgi:hypothetical protein